MFFSSLLERITMAISKKSIPNKQNLKVISLENDFHKTLKTLTQTILKEESRFIKTLDALKIKLKKALAKQKLIKKAKKNLTPAIEKQILKAQIAVDALELDIALATDNLNASTAKADHFLHLTSLCEESLFSNPSQVAKTAVKTAKKVVASKPAKKVKETVTKAKTTIVKAAKTAKTSKTAKMVAKAPAKAAKELKEVVKTVKTTAKKTLTPKASPSQAEAKTKAPKVEAKATKPKAEAKTKAPKVEAKTTKAKAPKAAAKDQKPKAKKSKTPSFIERFDLVELFADHPPEFLKESAAEDENNADSKQA